MAKIHNNTHSFNPTLKLKRAIKSILFSIINRVKASFMSWLIAFVLADYSCLTREKGENYKIKNLVHSRIQTHFFSLSRLAL